MSSTSNSHSPAHRRRSGYAAVFTAPGAPALLTAATVARLPLGMVALAAVLLVEQATGSFARAGAVAAAYAVGAGVIGPLWGRTVDRIGQTRVLVVTGTVNATALVALVIAGALNAPIAALLAASTVAGAARLPIAACARSLWPSLLTDPAALDAVFALEAVLVGTLFIIGPVLVGGIVAIAGPGTAPLVAAGVGLTGTMAFASLPASRRATGKPSRSGLLGALSSPGLRTILAEATLGSVAVGALDIGVPAFAVREGAAVAAGVALAALSATSFLGGLWYGARRWSVPVEVRYATAVAVFGVTSFAPAGAWSIPTLVIGCALAGVSFGPGNAAAYVLTGRVAPEGTLTEAHTWTATALAIGTAGGHALGGLLIEAAGVRGALFSCAAFATASAAVVVLRIDTLRGRAPAT